MSTQPMTRLPSIQDIFKVVVAIVKNRSTDKVETERAILDMLRMRGYDTPQIEARLSYRKDGSVHVALIGTAVGFIEFTVEPPDLYDEDEPEY